jgi:hypothetical protein
MEIAMLARPTLTKRPNQDEVQSQRVRAAPRRSSSCSAWTDKPNARSAAGTGSNRRRCGKKAYPLVMVTIVDTEDGIIEVIKE